MQLPIIGEWRAAHWRLIEVRIIDELRGAAKIQLVKQPTAGTKFNNTIVSCWGYFQD